MKAHTPIKIVEAANGYIAYEPLGPHELQTESKQYVFSSLAQLHDFVDDHFAETEDESFPLQA